MGSVYHQMQMEQILFYQYHDMASGYGVVYCNRR